MGKVLKGMPGRQTGFTLIEIVMVLVLLGILAAVAVPKYFDLQEQARNHAFKASIAELQARVNANFAKKILEGEKCDIATMGFWEEVRKLEGYTPEYALWNKQEKWQEEGILVAFSDAKGFVYKGGLIRLPVCPRQD